MTSVCITVNVCDPNPCKNDGSCIVQNDGGFTCVCDYGFIGDVCDGKILQSSYF